MTSVLGQAENNINIDIDIDIDIDIEIAKQFSNSSLAFLQLRKENGIFDNLVYDIRGKPTLYLTPALQIKAL